jgi:hypothetical protein
MLATATELQTLICFIVFAFIIILAYYLRTFHLICFAVEKAAGSKLF